MSHGVGGADLERLEAALTELLRAGHPGPGSQSAAEARRVAGRVSPQRGLQGVTPPSQQQQQPQQKYQPLPAVPSYKAFDLFGGQPTERATPPLPQQRPGPCASPAEALALLGDPLRPLEQWQLTEVAAQAALTAMQAPDPVVPTAVQVTRAQEPLGGGLGGGGMAT
eukprot:Hpha_TRINITY_DN35827_c0_g1::TRINITY_DN35827_c0_g1_i1::g.84932::m.84932